MSDLRAQLLKAGVASKKQAHKAKQHQAKKRRNQVVDEPEASELAAKAVAEQKARDRALNSQKEAERQEKEKRARLLDLLQAHRLNKKQGDEAYNFTLNDKVCRIHTSKQLVKDLIAGRVGIIHPNDDNYVVVPKAIVERVQAIDAHVPAIVAAAKVDDTAENDEYADYAVPDDFSW